MSMIWFNVMLTMPSLCLCRYSSSEPFTMSSVTMYIGSSLVHTPISCTSFLCRSLCIIFASSRNASTVIVCGFSVLTATSTIRRHLPANYTHAMLDIPSTRSQGCSAIVSSPIHLLGINWVSITTDGEWTQKVIFNSIIHTHFWLFTLSQNKTNCNPLAHPHPPWKCHHTN